MEGQGERDRGRVGVDNIDTTIRRAAELGGKIAGGKIDLGGGYGAFFTDANGITLGPYEDKKAG